MAVITLKIYSSIFVVSCSLAIVDASCMHPHLASQITQPSSQSSVIPHPASTVATVSETCGGVESTPALQSTQSQVERDNQALTIALPIAMGTILVTAAVVGVGVVLCVKGRAQEKQHR